MVSPIVPWGGPLRGSWDMLGAPLGRVAELADAQDSGSCVRKDVGVQVPPRPLAHFGPGMPSRGRKSGQVSPVPPGTASPVNPRKCMTPSSHMTRSSLIIRSRGEGAPVPARQAPAQSWKFGNPDPVAPGRRSGQRRHDLPNRRLARRSAPGPIGVGRPGSTGPVIWSGRRPGWHRHRTRREGGIP
jgi:hypothetical protein